MFTFEMTTLQLLKFTHATLTTLQASVSDRRNLLFLSVVGRWIIDLNGREIIVATQSLIDNELWKVNIDLTHFLTRLRVTAPIAVDDIPVITINST